MGFWDRHTLRYDESWETFALKSFVEKIVSFTQGRANELIQENNIAWKYIMLKNPTKELKWKDKEDLDYYILKKEEDIIISKMKAHSIDNILEWLLFKEKNNHPSELSEVDKYIFAFALMNDFYSDDDIYKIHFEQGEAKEIYMWVYGLADIKDLKKTIDNIE